MIFTTAGFAFFTYSRVSIIALKPDLTGALILAAAGRISRSGHDPHRSKTYRRRFD
ncbi:MAG: hypothetical protein AAFO74_16945 [Pseudomonadota bacterium]